MCGIIGGTCQQWDFKAANRSIIHRGPDSQNTIWHDDITLSFTRLSIIDLSHEADQPMASEDGSLRIVFNGEIYGYRAIRDDLVRRGHKFRTSSDTEVVLNAYREWGLSFIEHLDGMFAIGIHDIKGKRLVLYRDRPGIKPVYYYYVPGKDFAFASELKAIRQLCTQETFDTDRTALYDYLTYGYVPDPKTIYKNVYKLSPAHMLIFDLNKKKITDIKRFWQLAVNQQQKKIDADEAAERLRGLITESVADQLVADVPVGAFLSGGIDSSVVVSEAVKIDPDIQTFSIGFDDKAYTETQYAETVARHLNVNNYKHMLSCDHTCDLLYKLKDWYDEPFSDTSAFPSFLVAEYAKKKVKVALTGDGGDEVFGGYPRYGRILKGSKYRFQNRLLNQALLNLSRSVFGPKKTSILFLIEKITGEDLAAYTAVTLGATTFIKEKYRKEWGIPGSYDTYWYFRQYDRPDLPLLTRLQYLDFHTYLPSDILTKVDRVTMANALEARVPLLSRKIIEFSFSLPESLRYYGTQNGTELKGLLKYAYKEILPKDILARKKMGFAVPSDYFFHLNTGKKSIEETLLEKLFPLTAG